MGRRGECVYLRKDGLWEARYVKGINEYGKKKYGSVYAHSYREAKEKRQDILSQISLLPQSVSMRRMRLNTLIEEWLFVNQNRIKFATYQKYKTMYENHIEKEIGAVQIIYLTPILFKNFADKKQSIGLAASTINVILTFIGTCLKYGSRQYGLPPVYIPHLKVPIKEMRVLSVEEQQKLVCFLLSDMDVFKLGVLTALYTGMRIGELCALQWKDVENGTIRITKTMQRLSNGKGKGTEVIVGEPKTKNSYRIIPLPAFLADLIEKVRSKDKHAYFLSTANHTLVEPRLMEYHFNQYIKRLNFPKANFHCLRHSFATRCIECGFEIKSLSEVLGHSSVNITLNRYVHSSIELKASNMEKLPTFL